ncbi:glycosyl transferase [Martelella sp. AD-3]|uniref:glycosyl transferase n=1 Tax=Martelella sp. AD-3 TaxID=686597 RepID=UPI000463CBD8|nr:glycosyl transferase [Martelella sp. AD-3]AMM83062.1 glycosyl transferase [Martelella sp. AD-3]
MLSVVIETNHHEAELAHTLSTLVVGAVEGLVSDVIVLDRGSDDGTERVAEAAGCRYLRAWDLPEVIRQARGDWILVLEPGARPLSGWVEAIFEHMALETRPARFSRSRRHRRSLRHVLFKPRCPLEVGVLLPKPLAVEKAEACGASPFALARRQMTRKLSCEIIPAWASVRV